MQRAFYSLSFFFSLIASAFTGAAQTWTPRTDIPDSTVDGRWGAYSFTIANKIYAGGGYIGNFVSRRDLFEYDISAGTWAPKRVVPGSLNRTAAVSFAVNGKGYVGLGARDYNTFDATPLKDLMQYDPATDMWAAKAQLPDSARMHAACFVIGDKAFVVGGLKGYPEDVTNDLWMYDAANNTWTEKKPFPEPYIYNAMAFTLNGKGYVVGGRTLDPASGKSVTYRGTWEYDPVADSWQRKADYCDTAGRENGVAFVLKGRGYAGTGRSYINGVTWYFREFCMFDPASGWSRSTDLSGIDRAYAVATATDDKAYLGGGFLYDGSQHYYKDWFEYDAGTAGVTEAGNEVRPVLFPNPASREMHVLLPPGSSVGRMAYHVFHISGAEVQSGIVPDDGVISLDQLAEGCYFMRTVHDGMTSTQRFIIAR